MPDPGSPAATYEDYLATPPDEWWELGDGRLWRWGDPDGLLADEATVTPATIRHHRGAGCQVGDREIEGAPTLVVEVSSPATYRHDRVRKRGWYEAAGVQEYWFVDLDQDQVEVYRLRDGRYPPPEFVERDGIITSSLPELEVALRDIL